MQADDDVPTLEQLLKRNRVLQHDFEQAEHHRQADDDSESYDGAAEDDAAAYLRRHDNVLGIRLVFHGRVVYLRRSGSSVVLVTAGDGGLLRRIPLDPSGDRGS